MTYNTAATTGTFDANAKTCSFDGSAVTLVTCKDGYYIYAGSVTKCLACTSSFTLGGTAIADLNALTCTI
jgi:hypothetical protein